MSSTRKYKIHILTALAILSFSTFIPALAYAAPLANNDRDWQHVNGNSWAWNYSPQTQINKDNVDQLEVKWIIPIGGKELAPEALQAASIGETTTTPPIVRDGLVYVISSFMKAYAFDAKTSKQVWTHQYEIDVEEIKERLPIQYSGSVHKHGFDYWEGGDAIINHGMACDFYGLDAKTGEMTFWVKDLCKDIPGNIGKYLARRAGAEPSIGIYEKGRQFVYVLSAAIHSNVESYGIDTRHVTMGIDMDTHQILWRVFGSPPMDRPDKDWALRDCDIGFFRDIPCSEAAAVNRAGLEWDFAVPGEPIGYFAGVTANWGQWIIDEDTGMLYTQTGNQGPYSNMTLAPGPRLYGSTIMAIDMDEGKLKWWLQPFPHDPYDYDCNWSGILVDHPTLGKVYVYGCKEGRYFVMDAATGEPKLVVDVRDDMYARGQISTDPHTLLYEPDPRSYHDMREWNWISWPAANPGEPGEHFTLPTTIFPDWYNGIFATDRAYDPETDTYVLHEDAIWARIEQEHSYFPGERNYKGGRMFTTSRGQPTNSTIVARDMATHEVKWTWFYPYSHQRSAAIVSGGMTFAGFTDGYIRFLDMDNGALLREINVGSPVVIQPTIGKDSDGNSKIFAVIGATRLATAANFGLEGVEQTTGAIIALGLSERAPKVTTTTVTTTATSSTTVTSTSATTTTVSVTETIGLAPEITYAAVAVAVIAIIAAAVLATRRRP